ncbi:MAG: hypothetical protein E7316_08370 [Clostridiales bacterium]|nr:hypothetical protein [Clostridiales bacterium]
MKRLFCLMLALVLLSLLPAVAEDNAAGSLELQELLDWAEGYRTRAMESQPLNDPTAPEAFSEDGYEFIYEFATLYMDRPEMTDESVLKNIVIMDPAEKAPHDTAVDMTTDEVLGAFYNENATLEGDKAFAALYISDVMPGGASWAWVQRDGQRLMTIQYAVHEQLATGGEGYTDAGLIYTMQGDLVAAIRAYGLDAVINEADVRDNLSAVDDVMKTTGYARVPVSYIGTDLTGLTEADLTFSGVEFLSLTPEKAGELLGQCQEDQWMEDDTGEFIRTMEFPGCEVSFVYDANKENPVVDTLSIMKDGMEGPRAVRIGDVFSSVLTRFRYGEGEYADLQELLYTDAQGDNYGLAEYGADASALLHYTLKTADGRSVVLYLHFEYMELTEILLYIND